MRKLLIAGLAVASLTGIAYAQVVGRSDAEIRKLLIERMRNPPTCVDATGKIRKLDDTVTVRDGRENFEFRCVETHGERMKSNGANWVQISPENVRYFNPD